VELQGTLVNPATVEITINPGPNWIGFPVSQEMEISNAFSNFAVEGDMVEGAEGMSEYLKLHLDSQPKPIVTLLAMKTLEERLPQNFMRIHRSYIVNLDKIQEVNKNRVILDADTYLPIGDSYKEQFNKFIESKFLGK
jgi:DNA-binding LytR/AlgR family response regulator